MKSALRAKLFTIREEHAFGCTQIEISDPSDVQQFVNLNRHIVSNAENCPDKKVKTRLISIHCLLRTDFTIESQRLIVCMISVQNFHAETKKRLVYDKQGVKNYFKIIAISRCYIT